MSDYISREALIDRLNKNLSACNHGTFSEMCYADTIETVKHLPTADVEPVRHWIPRSERMPEVGVEVLVYSRSSGMAVDYYDRGLFGYSDVTHWMPLPEPPEEVLP